MNDIGSTVMIPSAFAELASKLDPLSTPEEVNSVLGVPVNTLNDWRSKGRGPKFVKLGRSVYYRRDAILDYLRESEFSSVSEAKAANK